MLLVFCELIPKMERSKLDISITPPLFKKTTEGTEAMSLMMKQAFENGYASMNGSAMLSTSILTEQCFLRYLYEENFNENQVQQIFLASLAKPLLYKVDE